MLGEYFFAVARKVHKMERDNESMRHLIGEILATLSLGPNVQALGQHEVGRELLALADRWKQRAKELGI